MLINETQVINVLSNRVVAIPFRGVDTKGIIESITKCRTHLDHRGKDDRSFYIPGPPNKDWDKEDNIELVECDGKGCTYIQYDNTGMTLAADIFYDHSVRSLFQAVFEHITTLHRNITGEEVEAAYQNSWFYIATPQIKEASFHVHTKFKENYPKAYSNYTWTYYVQKPNNCIGEEGMLSFATDEEGTDKFDLDVQLDTLYVFPSNLYHRPNLSPNSSVDRITAAGNICIPHSNKCFLL